MRIGIIGAGNVGGTLGSRWAQAGHTVVFASNDPQSAKMGELLRKAGTNARAAASVQDAVDSSDVVVLAVPWETAREVVESVRPWEGKILVDATNPLLPQLVGLSLGTTTSAGESIAKWAQGARVVKAFNTVGFNIMANPDLGGGRKAVMFYCGDDKEAKGEVHQLATGLGFDAADAGPLTQARVLEPFALLWISLAYGAGYGRDIGFQFVRRQ